MIMNNLLPESKPNRDIPRPETSRWFSVRQHPLGEDSRLQLRVLANDQLARLRSGIQGQPFEATGDFQWHLEMLQKDSNISIQLNPAVQRGEIETDDNSRSASLDSILVARNHGTWFKDLIFK